MAISDSSQQGNQATLFFGIVLEDKPKTTTKIKVNLQEMTPFVEGKVEVKTTIHEVKSENTSYSSSVETTNAFEAEFFNIDPNRRYPPDLKKNEIVFVFNYSNDDTYWWLPLGRYQYIRRTERLNFGVSDSQEPIDSLTDLNTYFIELDTDENKWIRICTSNSDKEKYRYLIKLDSKTNSIQICDDSNNEILLESEVPRIRLRNASGTVIDLVKEDALLIVPRDMTYKVGRQLVIDSPILNFINQSCVFKGENVNFDCSNGIVAKSPCIETNGAVLAQSIVSGPITAAGYSTGEGQNEHYTPVETNIAQGTSTNPSNSPIISTGAVGQRHSAAWEEVQPALVELAQAVLKLASYHHENLSGPMGNVKQLAERSIMPKNTGE